MKLSASGLFASSSGKSASARKKSVRLQQQQQQQQHLSSNHSSSARGDELASTEQAAMRMSSTSASERTRPTTPGAAAASSAMWSRKHRHSDSHAHAAPSSASSSSQQTQQERVRDHVVVGIAASLDDEVEDWTEDFMDSTKSDRGSERQRTGVQGDRAGDLAQRFSSNFHHASSALQRATLRWHRQHSLDSNYSDMRTTLKLQRNSRLRKSSGDMPPAAAAAATTSTDTTAQLPATAKANRLYQTQLQETQEEDDDAAEKDDDESLVDAVAAGSNISRLALHATSDTRRSELLSSGRSDRLASETEAKSVSVSFDLDDEADDAGDDKDREASRNGKDGTAKDNDDDDDEDEDWDVEFGFADASDDEQSDAALIGSAGAVDSTRRRSENFNIFLRNFHDMMDGDALSDDDDDDLDARETDSSSALQSARASKRAAKSTEEPLFQRKRSEYHASHSLDGSVDGTSRASLTSISGAVEYMLVDKYRLVDVASSSAYAVRIERYPKPCATFSNLERDAGFASFSENRLERWLASFVKTKCALATSVLERAREQMANPRQQKNHQFRTLVSLPFGKAFVVNCFKQVALYRYFGEEKSNRELVRVFFEKASTTAYADGGDWAADVSAEDFDIMANYTMEILQEAARMFGPKPPAPHWSSTSLSFSSASSHTTSSTSASSSATVFWMRQFQSILLICAEAFPTYRHVIALIELRYVCHHLLGFASGDFTHVWQVCSQLPAFCPMELIAGDTAPNVANEILEYYGALFVHLNTSAESRTSWHESSGSSAAFGPSATSDEPATAASRLREASFGISPDAICLQALVLCDIQCLYESRSVLAEVAIPELVELFEFEDDDMNIDPRLMELLETEVKVQSNVPGLYTGARGSSSDEAPQRAPERRNSSSGLGGWSTEARLTALLKPSNSSRLSALAFFYERIAALKHPLVKAKCALVLGSMHHHAGSLANLRAAESLTYEAVRILEACSSKKLEPFATGTAAIETADALCLSMCSNDGLLSELGREALEQLGNVLIKNQKYRYGVLALEAASELFGFLNQGCAYEKMDRLLCRLTLEADDVARALPLHEKVAASAQRQGNITEFVYLTQALTNLWVREGAFARAEANLLAAFRLLREHTSVLPPSFLAFIYSSSSYAGSDAATSSRSGTMMTASTSTSSSLSGSFHLAPPSRSHTSELDSWLNHDVSLHLLVREVYRSSGRCLEGMQVLHYALSYSSRLPRGKRTQLQMLLAEDALKMSLLETCRHTFAFLDHEANAFCERLKENIVSSTIGSSSGTGTGNGSSSGGGRSMGGLGSEARYCFDMVFSMRYVLCRAKCHAKAGEYRDAFTWLSLAHVKSDKENLRKQAQLHVLDGKVLFGLYREFYEQRRRSASPAATAAMATPEALAAQAVAIAAEVDDTVTAFAGSFYGLSTKEKSVLTTRLVTFCACARSADVAMETGVKALWTAFDQYQALDDGLHQLKALLEIVTFSLAPIEQSFFALGSNVDDDLLKSYLYRGSASFKTQSSARTSSRSVSPLGDGLASPLSDDDVIEKTRRSVLDAQKLLRRAMHLAEQVADPASLLRTLIFCSEAWLWLERIASYKNDKAVKEAAAFWEEAVRLLKAVFLRRVAFHSADDVASARYRSAYSPAGAAMRAAADSSYCVVPILNFSGGVIVRLERMTLQLIYIACQLQHLERVPEYVEEMLSVHLDELLSAKLCLSTIAQQLAAFREHQRPHKRAAQSSATSIGSAGAAAAAAATPRSSVSAVSSDGSTRAASFSSSNSTPALHSGSGTPSSSAAAAKRKGHKKNQSMSSISELLASSGSPTPSTSFHDISSSFSTSGSGGNRSGSFLGTSATPRTGLASLSERVAAPPHSKGYAATGIHPPLIIRPLRGHGYERSLLRTRGRSSSAPQPLLPTPRSKSGARSPAGASYIGGEPLDVLTPVHESESHASRRIVDLADVGSWSRDDLSGLSASDAQRGYNGVHTGDGSSSTGVIGAYDFDEVQSERLWWIFNMWRDAKAKYTTGKLESSAFRTQNLRYLRTLLDTFEPHQVAVLYVNSHGSASVLPSSAVLSSSGSKGTNAVASGSGIVGFDVAHIHSYALLQEHDLVLSIGYDLDKAAAPQLSLTSSTVSSFAYAQLKFKVFGVKDGETSAWRAEIPRPDWYLKHYDMVEAESASSGAGALRTLRLLGPKLLVKLVGLLLLENAVVVTGASFPQVQEVTLSLLKLLQPFQWPHTFVPFVPITSWRFLYDSLHLFAYAQQAARPKSRKSFSRLSAEWRWGGGGSSSAPSSSSASLSTMVDAVDSDEPPFLFGATTETWQSCMLHARARGDDTARTIAAHVTVVDLECLETFAIAKSSLNAVSLPRKWRKHFLERFDKVVKQRRKVQHKVTRRLARQSRVPSTPGGALSTTSTPYGGGNGPASSSYVAQSPVSGDDAYRHVDMLHRSYDDGCSSSRSASSLWMSQGEAGLGAASQGFVASVLSAEAAASTGRLDDRLVYDAECFAAFLTGLHDLYDKVRSICDEKDKKLKGSGGKKAKSSGLSKRQEIKAWFSSSHDFDAFADKFHETEVYLQYQKDTERQAAAAAAMATDAAASSSSSRRSNGMTSASSVFALLSVGSSGSGSTSQTLIGGPGNGGSSSQLSRQLRSAGSLSSTSSAGVGGLGL